MGLWGRPPQTPPSSVPITTPLIVSPTNQSATQSIPPAPVLSQPPIQFVTPPVPVSSQPPIPQFVTPPAPVSSQIQWNSLPVMRPMPVSTPPATLHPPIPRITPAPTPSMLNLAPQRRESLEVSWVPGFQAPSTLPVLPGMVRTETLESMEESLKNVLPEVNFEEETIRERKRFLQRYEQQVYDAQKRCQDQLRLFAIKKEECEQLETWDRNLEALRSEKTTNRKRTPRPLKRPRTNPNKPGTKSTAGKNKKITKRRRAGAQDEEDEDDDGDHDQVTPVLAAPLAQMNINPLHEVNPFEEVDLR